MRLFGWDFCGWSFTSGATTDFLARHPLPVLVGVTWLIVSFATTVILAAAAARAGGYRLVSGPLQRRSSGF
jgi:hypothetical protein